MRREELAARAGVSVDYYARLEQGRSRSASTEVLDALATALALDDAERQHLVNLAHPEPSRRHHRLRAHSIEPATLTLLEALDRSWNPAFVLGRRLEVLAHNDLCGALIAPFRTRPAAARNVARFVFLEAAARRLYRDWDDVARDTVAMLRLDVGRHPDDLDLTALIGELSAGCSEFAPLWAEHHVLRRTTGTKTYRHPKVGEFTVDYQALHPGGDLDQAVIVYSTRPGTPDHTALRRLSERAG